MLYTDPSGHYVEESFNCYAYAFGYSDRWLIPGGNKQDNAGSLPAHYSVGYAAKLVLSDFGKSVRKIKNKKSKIKKGEYRIALRVSEYCQFAPADFIGPLMIITWDFHFWKQNPKNKKWWHKPGQGNIKSKGKADPDKKKNWFFCKIKFPENSRNNKRTYKKGTTKKLYYNSKTVYFAFKGEFWSKWKFYLEL